MGRSARACGVEPIALRAIACAQSVNPIDIKIRDGKMKMIYGHKPPRALGEDIAGKVVKLGPGASKLKEGDEVWASTAPRTHERVRRVRRRPRARRVAQAEARVVRGSRVLAAGRVFVRAGSGGIGVAAIQLGKAIGAHVATATSAGNLEWVRGLGADEVPDYRGPPFERTLARYDLALETSAEKEMLRSFAVVREGGYVISIGDVPDGRYARDAERIDAVERGRFGVGVEARQAFLPRTEPWSTRRCPRRRQDSTSSA
jgi:alcohol dehydrogenase